MTLMTDETTLEAWFTCLPSLILEIVEESSWIPNQLPTLTVHNETVLLNLSSIF